MWFEAALWMCSVGVSPSNRTQRRAPQLVETSRAAHFDRRLVVLYTYPLPGPPSKDSIAPDKSGDCTVNVCTTCADPSPGEGTGCYTCGFGDDTIWTLTFAAAETFQTYKFGRYATTSTSNSCSNGIQRWKIQTSDVDPSPGYAASDTDWTTVDDVIDDCPNTDTQYPGGYASFSLMD